WSGIFLFVLRFRIFQGRSKPVSCLPIRLQNRKRQFYLILPLPKHRKWCPFHHRRILDPPSFQENQVLPFSLLVLQERFDEYPVRLRPEAIRFWQNHALHRGSLIVLRKD